MNLGGAIKPNVKGLAVIVCVALCLLVLGHSRWLRSDETSTSPSASRLSGRALLGAGLRAAVAGGEAVRDAERTPARSKGKTAEGADEPVTDADVASHCRMVGELEAAFPGLNIVSEERVDAAACPEFSRSSRIEETPPTSIADEYFSHEHVAVWIDPLDATQEYTEKLYEYVTTMVCVAVRGVPIIGIVHRPFRRETIWAWVSKGTSKILKEPISDSKRPPTVIVSRSHAGKVEKFVKEAFGSDYEVKPAGGAGYKVLELVGHEADVYVHTSLIKKWDICAGNAILEALGGRMTTLKNETVDYSIDGDNVNRGGLVAAIKNHGTYVEKTKNAQF